MIAVEVSQVQQGFEMITGIIEHVGGRELKINGLSFNVPERGFCFVGIQLIAIGGMVLPAVRQLTGPVARRFSTMNLNEGVLQTVISESSTSGQKAIPFSFKIPHPRKKISEN